MLWNLGVRVRDRIALTNPVAKLVPVLSLLGGMTGVGACSQIIGLSDVPQEVQEPDGDSGWVDATVDAASPSPGAGVDSSSAEATLRDTQGGSADATLDGPSRLQEGSLDTGNDAPALEGSACSGLQCDGGCVPNDTRNCGACGHDCTAVPNVVAAGLSCAAGQCVYRCAPGYADCSDGGTGCSVSLSQNGNCGACGVTCTGPTPVCAGSGCTSSCNASAPTLCGSTCANTQSDPQNCGTCGHICTTTLAHATAICSGGTCTIQCDTSLGYSPCSGACVDEVVDNGNCGACGVQCLPGTHCVGSHCACDTSSGCAGCCSSATTCAPLANETRTSCGAGGNLCGTCRIDQVCDTSKGACACPTGQTICGGTCVDESKDNLNCGACGTQCASGTTCAAGQCVCNGSSGCVGCCSSATTCTPLASETSACGTGGSACTACTVTGQTCVGGACACPGGQSVCGAACVNLNGDPSNCGRCGHGCQGGTCPGGICQPVTLVSGADILPVQLVIDATNVYFTNNSSANYAFGTVRKCGITGGCSNADAPLVPTAYYPTFITLGGGNLYWANDSQIVGCGLPGCAAPTNLVDWSTWNGPPTGIAVDPGNYVYWANAGVARVPVGGAATAQGCYLAGGAGSGGVVVSSGQVYFTFDQSGGGVVSTTTACPGTTTSLASLQNSPGAVAVASGAVYWANLDSIVKNAGGSVVTIASGQTLQSSSGIAVDSTNVYWTDSSKSAVMTCPIAGCNPTTNPSTFVSGQAVNGALAVDATSVYWATSNSVMKLAKP